MSEIKLLWGRDEDKCFTNEDLSKFFGVLAHNEDAIVQINKKIPYLDWCDNGAWSTTDDSPTRSNIVSCWRIIKRHNKRIDLSRAVGSGILFKLYNEENGNTFDITTLDSINTGNDGENIFCGPNEVRWDNAEPVYNQWFSVQNVGDLCPIPSGFTYKVRCVGWGLPVTDIIRTADNWNSAALSFMITGIEDGGEL
jgi:hypothetical protein